MLGLIVVGDDLSNLDDIAQSKTKGQSSKKLSELIAQLGYLPKMVTMRT